MGWFLLLEKKRQGIKTDHNISLGRSHTSSSAVPPLLCVRSPLELYSQSRAMNGQSWWGIWAEGRNYPNGKLDEI
jgi:hypothetical protein